MKLEYYRGRWPEEVTPDGEPELLLYAVDIETDCVLKTVDIYPDGRLERNNFELVARYGGEFTSLVEGSFKELTSDWDLDVIEEFEFVCLYEKSTDKPLQL